MRAAREVEDGLLDDQFPLSVWQTGSGTQSNMNANEVIANRAIELAGGDDGVQDARSTPTTTSTCRSRPMTPSRPRCTSPRPRPWHGGLVPSVRALRDALGAKADAFGGIVKIGRTHLQDAVPLTLGQEFSGYVAQLDADLARLEASLPGLYELALGGTAVGTGLNAPAGFGEAVAARLAAELRGCRSSARRTSSPRLPRTAPWSRPTARSARWPRT